jgi:nucleotidyltransferase/DNA polymerase involved in DNA repair
MVVFFSEREANLKDWLSRNEDLSQETYDNMLVVGAQIVQEIREDVYNSLQFRCSAGVAHNKVGFFNIFLLITFQNKFNF